MKTKRILSLLLALTLLSSLFILTGTQVTAANTIDVYMLAIPRGSDPNQSNWNHPALNLKNGWTTLASTRTNVKSMGYNQEVVYCIGPGVDISHGDTLTQRDETYWNNYPDNLNRPVLKPQFKVVNAAN